MDSEVMRHSVAHVMAAAVCRLYKDVRLDIGPASEDGCGFYYDFDLPNRLSQEDFSAIEKEMAAIVSKNLPFERFTMPRVEAEKMLKEAGQTFKVQRLAEIPEGQEISFYRCGEFVDLCRGPHLASTGEIKGFKLLTVSGSYFHGKETNPMLQRVYGIAAASEKELNETLTRIEEAKKRDHRKLGKELDLFSISEDVGPGLIHWHPKGARIRSLIEEFWRAQHFKAGYELMYTPHIGRAHLWETSGHLGFYKASMYSSMEIEGAEYYAKPMNCPFHIQIYKTHMHSYRELPLRWAELGTVYRYEKSGVLNGLFRVRGFTQDDAHIFCTPEQIEDVIKETVRFALKMLRGFGFSEFSAYLSTKPEDAVGDPARWEQATASLESALKAEGLPYGVDAGGGAFYGPKIDMRLRDAIGREWQLSTIQFDFNMPARFDLTYIGEDGKEHQPYMVHRALLGSLERFFGILIEHYAGAFPLWLAPEQVRVMPIAEAQEEYARGVVAGLRDAGYRAVLDGKSEKIGAKIRRAQTDKIPYMAVVGGREAAEGKISLRSRIEGDKGVMSVESLIAIMAEENRPIGF